MEFFSDLEEGLSFRDFSLRPQCLQGKLPDKGHPRHRPGNHVVGSAYWKCWFFQGLRDKPGQALARNWTRSETYTKPELPLSTAALHTLPPQVVGTLTGWRATHLLPTISTPTSHNLDPPNHPKRRTQSTGTPSFKSAPNFQLRCMASGAVWWVKYHSWSDACACFSLARAFNDCQMAI